MYKLFINSESEIQFKTMLGAVLGAEKMKVPAMILVEKNDVYRVYNPFLTDKNCPSEDFLSEDDALKYIGSFLC